MDGSIGFTGMSRGMSMREASTSSGRCAGMDVRGSSGAAGKSVGTTVRVSSSEERRWPFWLGACFSSGESFTGTSVRGIILRPDGGKLRLDATRVFGDALHHARGEIEGAAASVTVHERHSTIAHRGEKSAQLRFQRLFGTRGQFFEIDRRF